MSLKLNYFLVKLEILLCLLTAFVSEALSSDSDYILVFYCCSWVCLMAKLSIASCKKFLQK